MWLEDWKPCCSVQRPRPTSFIHLTDADGTRWAPHHRSWLRVKQGQGRWHDLHGEVDRVTGGLPRLLQGKGSDRQCQGACLEGTGYGPTTGAKHHAEGQRRPPWLLGFSACTLCASFPWLWFHASEATLRWAIRFAKESEMRKVFWMGTKGCQSLAVSTLRSRTPLPPLSYKPPFL